MGFSLKSFIEQLEDIMKATDLSLGAKYQLLQEAIIANKQYAKDCGQID